MAPRATVSVAFNAQNGLGLYQLTWDPTAPVGFVNTGTFGLSAEWWDGDPFAGGHFLSSADAQSAPYTATVTGVPVPSTLLLMADWVGDPGTDSDFANVGDGWSAGFWCPSKFQGRTPNSART